MPDNQLFIHDCSLLFMVVKAYLNTIYNCMKIEVNQRDTLLLVSLNKSFDQAKANGVYRRIDIYEATRKYWKIGKIAPQKIKYVLGVYKGVVRSVIEITSWEFLGMDRCSGRWYEV